MSRSTCYRIALTGCISLLASHVALADIVPYEIIWDATWGADTHPGAYPNNAHFSGVVGATHTEDVTFWEEGGLATPGIKQVAEVGSATKFMAEIDAAITAGFAYEEVRASGLIAPTRVVNKFMANSTHPMLSIASMIAPSPDWLVGLSNVNLREDGHWVQELTFDALPYDAGTDSGVNFSSANEATLPPELISRITGAPFFDAPPLGTFKLNLLTTPGDFDQSGKIDVGDIDILCFRRGETHAKFELSGDQQITLEDVSVLITDLAETRPGDINLDGIVDFTDFLVLSTNFGLSGDWSGGDSDCNRRIEFADFLALSNNFGFSRDATSPVPEPLGIRMLLLGIGLMFVARPRRRRRRR